jgi:error-prone DNA polymerase
VDGRVAERTVIQWDKDDLEELGLFKVDLLALGALHQIHLALDLLRDHRGVELTMATIPPEDPETYDLMCTADTVGVFQIESRAQMAMLPRLKPRHFYDLVIEISLVRPGPITGGMVHPYLRRRDELEPVEYPHPSLKPVLARTLGVPLFQEQVMKLAIIGADYTPGEADQLRRDMAAWRRSGRIDQHRERLIGRMISKGIAPEFAERVFEQIRGFGEYGFPESHAASFALIAYATAWLRRHYPAEFLCALLNAQPMGFYAVSTIIGDAQRHEVEVRPIDVQHSAWESTLEPTEDAFDFSVRVGLRWIQGLRSTDGERIVAAQRNGPFASVADFVSRTRLSGPAHAAIAEAGALASLGPRGSAARRDALWQVRGWVARQGDSLPLGGIDDDEIPFRDLTTAEEIRWDYGISSHSTRGHPLAPLRAELRSRGWPDACTVQRGRDGDYVEYVGVVICRQQPGTASGVAFFTLEDETGLVNIVVWRRVLAEFNVILRTASPLGVSGRLQVQEQVVHLVVEKAWVPSLSRAPATVASRDFR